MLKQTWVGDPAPTALAREILAAHPELSQCRVEPPTQPQQLCISRVHFFGSKYFSRSELHRNRDALVARCFVRADCERLAALYQQRDGTSAPLQKCGETIPTSGAISLLSAR